MEQQERNDLNNKDNAEHLVDWQEEGMRTQRKHIDTQRANTVPLNKQRLGWTKV